MSVWTKPVQDALEACLAAGLSASQTAEHLRTELRVSVTRNAVIGKANRCGLMFSRPARARLTAEEKRSRKSAGAKQRRYRQTFTERKALREELSMATEPTPRGDVDDGCRYLAGEATLRNFCGAPKSGSTSWCAFHRNKCFDLVRSDKVRHLVPIQCEAAA
jgi:hypothetical protein